MCFWQISKLLKFWRRRRSVLPVKFLLLFFFLFLPVNVYLLLMLMENCTRWLTDLWCRHFLVTVIPLRHWLHTCVTYIRPYPGVVALDGPVPFALKMKHTVTGTGDKHFNFFLISTASLLWYSLLPMLLLNVTLCWRSVYLTLEPDISERWRIPTSRFQWQSETTSDDMRETTWPWGSNHDIHRPVFCTAKVPGLILIGPRSALSFVF